MFTSFHQNTGERHRHRKKLYCIAKKSVIVSCMRSSPLNSQIQTYVQTEYIGYRCIRRFFFNFFLSDVSMDLLRIQSKRRFFSSSAHQICYHYYCCYRFSSSSSSSFFLFVSFCFCLFFFFKLFYFVHHFFYFELQ